MSAQTKKGGSFCGAVIFVRKNTAESVSKWSNVQIQIVPAFIAKNANPWENAENVKTSIVEIAKQGHLQHAVFAMAKFALTVAILTPAQDVTKHFATHIVVNFTKSARIVHKTTGVWAE